MTHPEDIKNDNVFHHIMPYSILHIPTSTVNLDIGATSCVVTIDCSRVGHDVSVIKFVTLVHSMPVNQLTIYHATSSLTNNTAFANGRITRTRSFTDRVLEYRYQSPVCVRGLHTVNYTFMTPLASGGDFSGVYTIAFFSDPDGRYI